MGDDGKIAGPPPPPRPAAGTLGGRPSALGAPGITARAGTGLPTPSSSSVRLTGSMVGRANTLGSSIATNRPGSGLLTSTVGNILKSASTTSGGGLGLLPPSRVAPKAEKPAPQHKATFRPTITERKVKPDPAGPQSGRIGALAGAHGGAGGGGKDNRGHSSGGNRREAKADGHRGGGSGSGKHGAAGKPGATVSATGIFAAGPADARSHGSGGGSGGGGSAAAKAGPGAARGKRSGPASGNASGNASRFAVKSEPSASRVAGESGAQYIADDDDEEEEGLLEGETVYEAPPPAPMVPGESALSFFQFPNLLPDALVGGVPYSLLGRVPMRSEIKLENGTAAPDFRKLEGALGRMFVHASGKVAPSTQTRFVQTAVAIDGEAENYCRLGNLRHRYMVTPDVDKLLESL